MTMATTSHHLLHWDGIPTNLSVTSSPKHLSSDPQLLFWQLLKLLGPTWPRQCLWVSSCYQHLINGPRINMKEWFCGWTLSQNLDFYRLLTFNLKTGWRYPRNTGKIGYQTLPICHQQRPAAAGSLKQHIGPGAGPATRIAQFLFSRLDFVLFKMELTYIEYIRNIC